MNNLAAPADQPRIAATDRYPNVRCRAVYELTDTGALSAIAIHNSEPNVRREAVRKLTDQAVLAGIAMKDKSPDVREMAIYLIRDAGVLAGIVKSEPDQSVRRAAAEQLGRLKVARAICMPEATAFVARAAPLSGSGYRDLGGPAPRGEFAPAAGSAVWADVPERTRRVEGCSGRSRLDTALLIDADRSHVTTTFGPHPIVFPGIKA